MKSRTVTTKAKKNNFWERRWNLWQRFWMSEPFANVGEERGRKRGKEEGRKREREKLKLVISLSGREGLLAVYLLHTEPHRHTHRHPVKF